MARKDKENHDKANASVNGRGKDKQLNKQTNLQNEIKYSH